MKSRLQDKYRKETTPALMKRFGWKNVMAVPKVAKITVNIGLGEASQNAKLLDTAAQELGQITGQKAIITRAKKSIANFKIRKGMPIGCAVTSCTNFSTGCATSFFHACAISADFLRTRSTGAATTRSASRTSSYFRKSTTRAWTRSRA